jgi:hypothetical protein
VWSCLTLAGAILVLGACAAPREPEVVVSGEPAAAFAPAGSELDVAGTRLTPIPTT